MKKIIYFVSEDWYFCSHRLPVACAAKSAGYEVVVITQVNQAASRIQDEGFRLIPVTIDRGGLNPVKDFALFRHLVSILRDERPDILHNVALKPIVYGALAARFAPETKVINAFAGLGMVFSGAGLKAKMIQAVASILIFASQLSLKVHSLFQNPDDLDRLCSKRMAAYERSFLIRGSGVDTSKFSAIDDRQDNRVVLLASRLLWSKGIGDFVAASRLLSDDNVRFVIVGAPDYKNAEAVPESLLVKWQKEGLVEWWGARDDMVDVFSQASIVVLPSTYGEGVPKFLIEAASCALPIVTYDVPGCREIVHNGENGFLVSPNNIEGLAERIRYLFDNPDAQKSMGRAGRNLVASQFSESVVVEQTMDLYERVLDA